MVYSYRHCSGQRSVETDTAITAALVTGCDSHVLGETEVVVVGAVPLAGGDTVPGWLSCPCPTGCRGAALGQPSCATSPLESRQPRCSRGVSFAQHRC